MIAVDSSVAIAAFGEWHELNTAAAPTLVNTWLDDRFPVILPPPSAGEQRDLVRTMARAGRLGGAIYDALVALTARLEGAVLTVADDRAVPIYELVGVEVRHLRKP